MARTSAVVGTALAAAVLVAAPFFGAAGLESLSGSPAGATTAAVSGAEDDAVIRMIDDVAPAAERADQRERAEALARAASEETAALAAAAVAKTERDAAAALAAAEAVAAQAAAEAAEAAAAAASASSAAASASPAAGSPAGAPSAPAAPTCAGMPGGGTAGAPGAASPLGVAGTTSSDLAQFAQAYNRIRVSNCLPPIPFSSIRYDSCMEQRLFWMAEDPSTDPLSAWGHAGSQRSDGVPSVGCDGNLAGGTGNTGASVAQKWWDSGSHRASLYKPGASVAGVCILFSMTHGGVPNEPYDFTRAAARWTSC
ncbi:hypothetical protein [Microcella flavibacter]|uniref:hypothetical protein n=1 Tax=Microcella flavibacter TaxID=1804990 RepID=UPI0014576EC5|nr:hypothetical protein [Microcella flavibacter]